MLYQSESELRHWLEKHGKSRFVDFSGEELGKLRHYFRELDEDGSGKSSFEFRKCRFDRARRTGEAIDISGVMLN